MYVLSIENNLNFHLLPHTAQISIKNRLLYSLLPQKPHIPIPLTSEDS